MQVEQASWSRNEGWTGARTFEPQLVMVFGGRLLPEAEVLQILRARYPGAQLVGCSTAGEILDTRIQDDSLVVSAISFATTRYRCEAVACATAQDSRGAGERLGHALGASPGLVHVFVLSDGTNVNGTALVEGMVAALPGGVTVSGGLAGDGDRMQRTWVLAGDRCESGIVAAVGLYGDKLRVGYGCKGGWDTFGPERKITRAEGNVLYELDGLSALALYREYLGEHAAGLPSTGLLFPLELRFEGGPPRVRTILAIDDAAGSITFAGDMPVGHYARLMHANFDRLVDGAYGAARICTDRTAGTNASGTAGGIAILVSCVGRRLVLGQRAEEELESVREVLGGAVPMTGFYSNGELCPTGSFGCELHNQTMTITTISEVL
jgi:hypothetical protein